MDRNSVQMTVSLPPQLYKRAMAVARKEIRSKSEMVREALREYIVRRESFLEAREKLAKNLEKRKIRTLEDMERLIDEGRHAP